MEQLYAKKKTVTERVNIWRWIINIVYFSLFSCFFKIPATIQLVKVSRPPWSVFAAETTIEAAKKLLIIKLEIWALFLGIL